MSLSEKFNEAAEKVRKLQKRPDDKQLLDIYAMFKQATVGDCNIEKPSGAKESRKWEAWNSQRGLSRDAAMQTYIEKALQLEADYA